LHWWNCTVHWFGINWHVLSQLECRNCSLYIISYKTMNSVRFNVLECLLCVELLRKLNAVCAETKPFLGMKRPTIGTYRTERCWRWHSSYPGTNLQWFWTKRSLLCVSDYNGVQNIKYGKTESCFLVVWNFKTNRNT